MDGIDGALAMFPASHPSVDIVPTPAMDADPASIPVPVQMQTMFWTACLKCGLGLEYLIIYKNRKLRCPLCCKPFEAKEKSLDSIVGQTDSSIPHHAPNNEVPAKYVEALPCRKNLSMPNKIQYESSHGVSMHGVLLVAENGSIMQPSGKRQRKDLSGPFSGADCNKVSNYASFEMPHVPPERPKKASPENVIAELKNLPDLARMDWLKAFNMLRFDDFQFRSLKALPMDMRKEWLLEEIK